MDDLVRLFAGERISKIMDRFKIPDDQPMEASILSRQIENAQKKVEEQNFVMRKNVLKYDDVLNKQRTVIYAQRRQVLEGEDLSEEVHDWIEEAVNRIVAEHTQADYQEEWDLAELVNAMEALYRTGVSVDEIEGLDREAILAEFLEDARDAYAEKEEEFGVDPQSEQPIMRELERFVILQVVDVRWREHLENMDYLREGVHLRSMAQKDPLVEYTSEGHAMFEDLSAAIREEVVSTLFHAQLAPEEVEALQPSELAAESALAYEHESLMGADAIAAAGTVGTMTAGGSGVATAGGVASPAMTVSTGQRVSSERDKVGRNDPCWCGSGKKYKKCHGA